MASHTLQILVRNLENQMIDEITDETENAEGIVTEDAVGIETETGEAQNTSRDRATGQ